MYFSTLKYLSKASNIFAYPNFLVLRYARTRPLNGLGLITRLLGKIFKTLRLKSKSFKGLSLIINPSDFSHIKISDEFFFENIYNLDDLKFSPDCIVDCGAHIGMFTLLSKGVFPNIPIHAFEPNPENVFFIRKQVTANKLKDINIYESATSTYNGEASFDNYQSSFGGHITKLESESSYKVSVINLVEFLENLSTQNLLIKIDIEGEEENLLPKLIPVLPLNCVIFFEYHFGIERFNKMAMLLKQKGFDITIRRITDNLYIDAVAIRN